MAEALFSSASGSSDGEKDPITNDVDEAYRKLCKHYSRGCSFVSPCCGKVYHCRLCHDEQESHRIDRHAITEITCRKCSIRQSVANYCCNCGLQFGRYYFCAICNFYDDANNGQFHCEKCGICRARGKENFFHCDKCGFCLALEKRENHTCRQDISKNNCPICLEDIHTSRDPAHVPRCGHVLHSTCFKGLMLKGLYQCPQCQTSLVDMKQNWERLDAERESWVMPQQLRVFKVKILCRDCGVEGETCYHVAGLKCCDCGSYNTVRCGSEELPVVGTALLNRSRRMGQRRRRRHREERVDLEHQLLGAEQRAQEAERKLADLEVLLKVEVQRRVTAEENIDAIEQRLLLAEERADSAAQTADVALKRAELAEQSAMELEKKLYETESDLEELILRDTDRVAMEACDELCCSNSASGSLKILRNSSNSLSGFYISHESLEQQVVEGPSHDDRVHAGDELSITSL